MNKYNYNSWLALKPLTRALMQSTSKNGKYAVKKIDLKNGFYFDYVDSNIKIKVPLGAIFETNNKINGILGIKFTSSTDCPSERLGLCQVPKGAKCYGKQGEDQSRHRNDYYGVSGMGGDLNGQLCSYYWDRYGESAEIRNKFASYCEYYNIKTLRFNIKGDFRTLEDVAIIYHLAKNGAFESLYGYTARDDLYCDLVGLCESCDSVRLNGSNIRYNNRFYITEHLEDILKTPYYCRGSCLGCGLCRNLNGEIIYCLVHGSGSDTVLNNPANQRFVTEFFIKGCGLRLFDAEDWTEAKGFITCINKALAKTGFMLRFKDIKDLLRFMRNDKKTLSEMGVI